MAMGRAGKVRSQTPRVPKGTPPAPPTGKVVKKVGSKLDQKIDVDEAWWAQPELIRQMLRREQQLRMSPVMQWRYAECDDDNENACLQSDYDYDLQDEGLLLDEEIQQQVLDEFDVAWSPWEYRRACEQAAPAIQNECCWLAHDRMRVRVHSVGDTYPDAQLHTMDGLPLHLSELIDKKTPVVILAGSFS